MDALIEVDAAFPWFFAALSFVLGAVVGSFLNVCIYRIPEGRSIVSPGSACRCGRPIAWHDNIPILSWLILRGRARCCRQPFSVRYPAIELLTGLLFLACWLRHPPPVALAGMLLVSIFICATFIDLDHMIIPDRFTIGAAVVGVLLSATVPELHGHGTGDRLLDGMRALLDSTVGLLVSSGIILWIGLLGEVVLRKEAMGFGDVKFMGAIGAFLGWQGGVFAIFGGAMLGTLAFALFWLGHGLFARRAPASATPATGPAAESPVGLGRHTPFGPMLAGGALVYFLALKAPVDLYFRTVYVEIFAGR